LNIVNGVDGLGFLPDIDTNIDYLAYTQQATLFLAPNNERVYSNLVGDTGPLVYPALHLYIYSALHKIFPQASLIDIGGYVPSKKGSIESLEEGSLTSVPKGMRSGLAPLQFIWLGVYIATLFLVALISHKARMITSSSTAHPKRRTSFTLSELLSRLVRDPTPMPVLLGALSLSLRLHSIYVLRLFNDPLAMVLFYASVCLFMKRQWKIGSVVYSSVVNAREPLPKKADWVSVWS
jgi:alpha-1,3-mannosyltransferase